MALNKAIMETLEPRVLLSTYLVSNTNDSGAGSLRYGIQSASGNETIEFASTLSGSTIALTGGVLSIDDTTGTLIIQGLGAGALTITGGNHTQDFSVQGHAQISGMTITDGNAGSNYGGAINNSGFLTISQCVISGSSSEIGGGIYNSAVLTMSDCTLTGNSSDSGGGIYNIGQATISDCVVTGNTSETGGGGVASYANYGGLSITDSTISYNSAGIGGGLSSHGSSGFSISDSIITENTASSNGGGIYVYYTGNIECTNCTITGNKAERGGGAYSFNYSSHSASFTVTDCTFSGNIASVSGGGGGIYGIGTLDGTIVANSTNGDLDGDFTGTHNLIDDSGSSGLSGATNEIDANPHLSPLGYYGGNTETMIPLPISGNLALGNGWEPSSGTYTDQRGLNRPSTGSDIGAFQSQSLVVNTTGDGPTGFGQLSLRDAINLADILANASGDIETITFSVTGTISLSGSALTIDNAAGQVNIDGPGSGLLTVDAGGLSGVFSVEGTAPAEIEGLTITGGNAAIGAGIYTGNTDLTINECEITGNTASLTGGGVYANKGSMLITDSTISGNTAVGESGVNWSGAGGGIYDYYDNLTLEDCTLTGNTAEMRGGGALFNYFDPITSLTDCTLSGNIATTGGGGAIYDTYKAITLTNCTFSSNSAVNGGAIDNTGTANVLSCTFTGNSASNVGPTILNGGVSGQFLSGSDGTLNLGGDVSPSLLTSVIDSNGIVELSGTLDITGSTLNLTSSMVGASLHLENGALIIGGTVNEASGTDLAVDRSQTVGLEGVDVTGSGNIDVSAPYAELVVTDGLTITSTLTIEEGATLNLSGTETINGGVIDAEQIGSVAAGDESTSYITIGAGATVTLGSSTTLEDGAVIESSSGDSALINEGVIDPLGPPPVGGDGQGNQGFVLGTSVSFTNQGTVHVSDLASFSDASSTLVGAAMAISPTEVVFGWNGLPMTSGDTYTISESTDGTSFTTIGTTLPAGNYDVVEGLEPNTQYWFQVEEHSLSGAEWIYTSEPVVTNISEPDDYAQAYDDSIPLGVSNDQFGFYQVGNVTTISGAPVSTGYFGGEIPAGSPEGAFLIAVDGLVSTGEQYDSVALPFAVNADGKMKAGVANIQPISGSGPHFNWNQIGQYLSNLFKGLFGPDPGGGGDPIEYATGATEIADTDLSSAGFTGAWSITRNWTAQGTFVPDSTLGNGWINQSQTYLQDMGVGLTNPNILLVQGAYNQTLFGYNSSSDSYAPVSVSNDSLTHDSSNNTYIWLNTSTGVESIYYDFSSSTAANLQGKLKQYQDAYGNEINLTYNSAGLLTEVMQTDAAGDVELFQYSYLTSGVNAGKVSLIQQSIQREGDSSATVFRQALYTYYQGTYSGDDAFGNLGDLKTVTIEDGDDDVLSEDYYRYYTPTEIAAGAQGFVGGLAFAFNADSFTKLAAAFSDPFSATNAQIAPYADESYSYDSSRRVIEEVVGSMGASNSLGQGTYFFSYYANPSLSSATENFNTWITRTTETLPDGNQNIVYTSINGDEILEIQNVSSDPGNPDNVGDNWIIGYEYDSSGRLTETILTSAIDLDTSILDGATTISAMETALEPYSDLGLSEGLVYSSQGLIDSTTYYDTGFIEGEYVQQGAEGTPIEQDSYTYTAHENGAGMTIYPVATYIKYQSSADGGSTPETTSYDYTWQSNSGSVTNQIEDETTTNPVISTDDNGSGTATTTQTIYNTFGQPVWTLDASGYITYTAYDNATGTVIQSIQDVNSSDLPNLENYTGTTFTDGYNSYGVPELPSGSGYSAWETTAGQNLVTTNYVDDLGRAIEQISPAGNITLYVYDDPEQAEFTLPGVVLNTEDGTLTTTGPITMVRTDIPYTYTSGDQTLEGVYDETVTFSANTSISYTGGTTGEPILAILPGFIRGDGASSGPANVLNLIGDGSTSSPQFTIQSLTRTLYNNSGRTEGQETESDAYAVISNATYLDTAPGSAYSGSRITNQLTGEAPNGNYYAIYYGYDADGRQYEVIDANGTIQDTVYDSMERVVSFWTGTDDAVSGASGTPSYFVGSNAGTGNNMKEVESLVYDNGEVGNGNITEVIQYPDGNSTGTQDVSVSSYDFEDRRIATETGLTLNSSDALTTSSNNPYPQITVWTLDNLGDVLASLTFNGGSTTLADAIIAAASAAPGVALAGLVAFSTSEYDSENRDYEDETYSVDPNSGTIATSALTTYTFYDPRGNVMETIDPSGQSTQNVYDGAGRLSATYTTDAGAVDNDGSPVLTYADASTPSDNVIVEQTAYGYDGDNNLVETVDAQRLSSDSASTAGALFSYTPGSDGGLTVTPAGSSLEARINYSVSYYDQADRDIADVNFGTTAGSVDSVPSRSSSIQLTSYGYDAAGNQDTTTDPNGIVTQSYFDTLGRTTETIADYTDGTPTDSSNQITEYNYDGNNDITSEKAVMPNGTADQTTVYIFGVTTTGGSNINSNDLLGEVEYPDPSTGVAGASAFDDETYTYDALGEQTLLKDRNATTHVYTYDSQGRETSDTATVATGNPENVDTSVTELTYSYNSQGLPFEETSYNSSGGVVNQIENVYNGFGQLTGQYQSVSGAVNTSSTPEVQYVYSGPSNGSRLTEIIYPNGRILYYGYGNNALDNAIGRVDFLADANTSGGVGNHDVDYQYLGLDTIIGLTQGNGITETTTLNSLGEIAEMNYVNTSTDESTDNFQYGYDDDGNVLYEGNTVDPSLSDLYTYDNLNRVTSYQQGTLNSTDTGIVGSPSASQSWTYDALGNQLSVTTNGTETSNEINDQNQLTENGTSSLAYDKNGNMTTDQSGNTYIYNAWNKLVAVKNSSGTTIASYSYDANGNQVSQTESGTTTNFYLTNLGQVIEERQGTTVTAQNIWSIDYVNDLVQRTQGSTTYYAQHDANFDITAVTDTSGNVLERYTYIPYGNVTVRDVDGTIKGDGTIASSSIGIPYLFQDGRIDPSTGLYSFGARQFSQTLGRWVEQDPAGYINGSNTYQALNSNPVGWIDPTGLNPGLEGPRPTEPQPPFSPPPPSPGAGQWGNGKYRNDDPDRGPYWGHVNGPGFWGWLNPTDGWFFPQDDGGVWFEPNVGDTGLSQTQLNNQPPNPPPSLHMPTEEPRDEDFYKLYKEAKEKGENGGDLGPQDFEQEPEYYYHFPPPKEWEIETPPIDLDA